MIVAIMGEHIKARTPEHLLHVLRMFHTQNLRQLHQRVIIHARRAPVQLQQSCGGKHRNALQGSIRHSFAVKAPHGKIAAAIPRRHDFAFWNNDSAIRRAVHVGFFHQAAVRAIALRRKLDDPFVRHHFWPRAATASAHPEQGKQRDAYYNPVAADDVFFVLFNGNFVDDENYTNRSNQIFVFDWNGKPLERLILDNGIISFTVNSQKRKIYGISDMPEYHIVEFEY